MEQAPALGLELGEPSRSPETLARILNSIADPVFVKDRDHRWIYLNDACCRLIGRAREELLGKSDHDFFPKEQADVFWAKDDAVFEGGGENVNEEEITDAQGLVHTIVTKKSIFTDAAGRKTLVGIIRDVTAQRRAERELGVQTAILSSEQANSPDGILVVDGEGRIVSYNRRFVEMWGLTPDVVAARSDDRALESVLHALKDPEAFLERVRYLYTHRMERSHEEIELVDGRVFERHSAPVWDFRGLYRGRVWYFRDISERRRAEEALRQSEERLRLLVEGVHDYAIVRLDHAGRIATWNRGAERSSGYGAVEIIGRHFSCFFSREDQERGKPRLLLRIAAESGRVEDEGWRLRKDGSRYWASVVLTALKDEDGRLAGFAKVTRDITARRETEEALRKKSEELARSNAELEVYASAASHDLVDPLNTIRALSDLLAKRVDDALDATSRDLLRRIHGSADRMAGLVEELLAFSKARETPGPMRPVELDAVLLGVLADLESRLTRTRARVEADPLPTVLGHSHQMRQLFQNLIGNALKFHKQGVPPQVRLTSRARDDGFVEVSVADDGIGFDPKHAARIFDPFIRLHARSEYEGHGLGLALCRRIALQHGGRIEAAGAPGRGSVFTVILPEARPS